MCTVMVAFNNGAEARRETAACSSFGSLFSVGPGKLPQPQCLSGAAVRISYRPLELKWSFQAQAAWIFPRFRRRMLGVAIRPKLSF